MDFKEVTTNDEYQRLKDQETLKDRRENIQRVEQDFNNMIAPGDQTQAPQQQPQLSEQPPEVTEQPQPDTQADPRYAEADRQAAENANPIQELGTAIVGGGIDAVESLGGTAEALVKGKMLDNTFKPTWLQVQDDKEPMNKTVWGKFLRGIGEYAALNLLLRRGAKSLKAAKVPGASALSKATTIDPKKAQAKGFKGFVGRVTDPKSTVREAAFGAAADFTSSYSEGETLSTEAKGLFPYIPDWLVTQESDTPLERKMKNVIEGIGIGKVTDVLFAWRAAKNAEIDLPEGITDVAVADLVNARVDLQRSQVGLARMAQEYKANGKLTPSEVSYLRKQSPEFDAYFTNIQYQSKKVADMEKTLDPKFVSEANMVESANARQVNYDEFSVWKELQDPDVLNPDGFRFGTVFDPPDKGIFSARGDFVKGLRMQYNIDNDGILQNGRLPNLYTEAALEKRLAQFDPARRKIINDMADKLASEMEASAQGFGLDNAQLKNMSVAKYIDIIDEVAKSDNDVDALKQMLSYDDVKLSDTQSTRVLSMGDHTAAELLINATAGEISDLAQAGRSIDGVLDNDRQIDALLNRLDFLLMETGRSKYIAGFRLNALKNGNIEFTPKQAREVANEIAKKESESKEFIRQLKEKWTKDPSTVAPWLDALALADGSPQALDDMYKWAKNQVFNWKSLMGGAENKSAFFDALTSIMYNSVLSGPKTLMRALLGNTTMLVTRPAATLLGGLVSGDSRAVAYGLNQMQSGFLAVGEAFTVFRKSWNAGANNLQDIPYLATQRIPPVMDPKWKALGEVIKQKGNTGDMFNYQMTEMLYNFNNFIGVKYPMVTMNAIDSASSVILGRMEARNLAFEKAWTETAGEAASDKNLKDLINNYEKDFRNIVFDPAKQQLRSKRAKYLADEAGLKLSIKGKKVPLLGIDVGDFDRQIQDSSFLTRPFFLFMKTGWNALEVIQKHTPLLARFNDEYRAVMLATPTNMSGLSMYGIHTPGQLLEAQAMMQGRVAMGYGTVMAAIGLYTSGRLTGNGPADRETANAWRQTGWQPRSIDLTGNGDFISTDSLEPFNTFLNMVADIGDNSTQLGETATENFFRKVGFLIAQNVTNKSFLAGLQPFGDVLSLNPAQSGVYISNLLNNQLPWAGARKELANLINPGARELETDITRAVDAFYNRNPGLKGALPVKRDALNGEPIQLWDWQTRIFNAISPVQLSFRDNATRRALRESGFDLKVALTTDPLGVRKLSAEERSKFLEYFGSLDVEKQLKQFFERPDVQRQMSELRALRQSGIRSRTGEDGDRINGVDLSDTRFMKELEGIFRRNKLVAFDMMKKNDPQIYADYQTRTLKQRRTASGDLIGIVQYGQK